MELSAPLVSIYTNKEIPSAAQSKIQYLWRVSLSLLQPPSVERTDASTAAASTCAAVSSGDVLLSLRLSRRFMELCHDHGVELPPHILDHICPHCFAILIPSTTCQWRLKSRSRASKINFKHKKNVKNQVLVRCLLCDNTQRRREGIERVDDTAVKIAAASRRKASGAAVSSSSSAPHSGAEGSAGAAAGVDALPRPGDAKKKPAKPTFSFLQMRSSDFSALPAKPTGAAKAAASGPGSSLAQSSAGSAAGAAAFTTKELNAGFISLGSNGSSSGASKIVAKASAKASAKTSAKAAGRPDGRAAVPAKGGAPQQSAAAAASSLSSLSSVFAMNLGGRALFSAEPAPGPAARPGGLNLLELERQKKKQKRREGGH